MKCAPKTQLLHCSHQVKTPFLSLLATPHLVVSQQVFPWQLLENPSCDIIDWSVARIGTGLEVLTLEGSSVTFWSEFVAPYFFVYSLMNTANLRNTRSFCYWLATFFAQSVVNCDQSPTGILFINIISLFIDRFRNKRYWFYLDGWSVSWVAQRHSEQ